MAGSLRILDSYIAGVSFNGRTWDFDSQNVVSNTAAPAIKSRKRIEPSGLLDSSIVLRDFCVSELSLERVMYVYQPIFLRKGEVHE